MAVRSTMANLISRVRLLINDPFGNNPQIFSDQQIQDVLDASRQNMRYLPLAASPTYIGTTISYLDYYADLTDWEDDVTFFQFLTIPVTPSASENIAAHWTWAQTTLPPVFLIGKTYDVYRAAADLLERMAAQWVLSYNISVDGQNLQRGQAATALQGLARTYRMQQRAHIIGTIRTDLSGKKEGLSLGPTEIDYMGSGDGR
jgi:hypothetical protein